MCISCRFSDASRIFFFFFQAECGIRGLVRSRGLGDVYKRQEVAPGSGQLGLGGEDPQTAAREVDDPLLPGVQVLSLIHI